MSPISIIGCVVGIISCLIGVGTFVSAQITKAKQDGMVLAKVDQCVANTEEIKKDMKEKNKEIDTVIDQHTQEIAKLNVKMDVVYSKLNLKGE